MPKAIHITEIELFTLLREKLGEKEATSLVTFVKKEVEEQLDRTKHTLATREDIKHLESKLENRISNSYARVMWAIGLSVTLMLGFVYILQNQTNAQIAALQTQTNDQIKRIDQRIDRMEEKIDQRFDKMNEQMNQRFEKLEQLIRDKK